MTLPSVLKASSYGIPVFFLHRSGMLNSAMNPPCPDWHLWQAQAELLKDSSKCLEFCRAIVEAKLYNQASLLRKRNEADLDDMILAWDGSND